MIYLDVDAVIEVPVNVLPLTDDTDFVTRETAVAYNAAGMDLVWNFITPNGTITQTAVTPTTGGDYDWTHIGDGMYKIEIPATGGASINNDTEGTGYFTGICDGVLAWRGPNLIFRAAGLNDLLIEDAYSPLATQASVDTINSNVDAILVDTGTTIPALIGTPAGADIAADIAAIPTTAEIEAALINEGDGQQLIDAILQVINSSLDVPALELAAISGAVRTELATELARLDVAISTRLASASLPVVSASGVAAAAVAGATSITITGLAMDASKYAKAYLVLNEGDGVGFTSEILASSTGTTFNIKDALPAAVTANDTVTVIAKAR